MEKNFNMYEKKNHFKNKMLNYWTLIQFQYFFGYILIFFTSSWVYDNQIKIKIQLTFIRF